MQKEFSIKICMSVGGVIVYGSYNAPNLGPALHDFVEVLDDSLVTQCLTTRVDHNTASKGTTCTACRQLSHMMNSTSTTTEKSKVLLYATVEGTANGITRLVACNA